MFNKKNIDEEIIRLVQSVETSIPPKVENELRTKTETLKPKHRIWSNRLVLPLGIITSAAMMIATVLFLFPPIQKTSDTLISEIYTEFEIKDKNIKIIFVQSRDFNQFLEGENE